MRVAPSQSKHKLYVGNLPKDMSKEDLEAVLQPLVKGAPRAFAALPGSPAARHAAGWGAHGPVCLSTKGCAAQADCGCGVRMVHALLLPITIFQRAGSQQVLSNL